MDDRLQRIKELFLESEKRNGELAHKNFELKKRIAELEKIDIVHCKDCISKNGCILYNCDCNGDWFCADGERYEK